MINHKVKAHRGRIPKEQIWVFCIVDTSFSPSRGFCLVKNRSSEILLKIINDVVKEDSDEFKSYKTKVAKVKKYAHKTICHKYTDEQNY